MTFKGLLQYVILSRLIMTKSALSTGRYSTVFRLNISYIGIVFEVDIQQVFCLPAPPILRWDYYGISKNCNAIKGFHISHKKFVFIINLSSLVKATILTSFCCYLQFVVVRFNLKFQFSYNLFQTELTCHRIQEVETQASSNLELRNSKIEELTRANEELRHQISTQQKSIDQHKQQVNKCIEVVKKLLKEKSSIEKKEARQKCMQNRLRLGQFVTQRVGATFQENWTDGHAFQELAR